MNIRLMIEGAKSLVVQRPYPRVRTVEETHYLVWRSVGQALYGAMGNYEQEQEEEKEKHSTNFR